jgi:hypothetical protein
VSPDHVELSKFIASVLSTISISLLYAGLILVAAIISGVISAELENRRMNKMSETIKQIIRSHAIRRG